MATGITPPASWKPVEGTGLMAGALNWIANWIADLGEKVTVAIVALGNLAIFSFSTLGWLFTRRPHAGTLLPNFYQIGVLSLPVVALTGVFIGMVLAVQSYAQFRMLGMETRLGAVINMSLVRELGPVLAATMLAGRVGSAMAAELGTMRVTEQIDALSSMGANPIHYLVVPRFLACLVLIPALTTMADFMGVVAAHSTALGCSTSTRTITGRTRGISSGSSTSSTACSRASSSHDCHHRLPSRLHLRPGAERRRQGATSAFVLSFVMILFLDLILGIVLEEVYLWLWPHAPSLV